MPASVASTTLERWSVPTDDPVIEELTDELMARAELVDGPFPLVEPQARCLSSSLVRRVGLPVLARAADRLGPREGLDVGALDDDERQRFAGALLTCLDLPQVLSNQLHGIDGLDDDAVACVVGELTTEGAITDLVRRSILEGGELVGKEDQLALPMRRAFERCLAPEQLERLDRGGPRP